MIEAAWANNFLEEDGLVDVSAPKDSFVGKDLLPDCGEHPSDFTWIAEFFLGLFKKIKKQEEKLPPKSTLMDQYLFQKYFIK